jgi:hypothetical protein
MTVTNTYPLGKPQPAQAGNRTLRAIFTDAGQSDWIKLVDGDVTIQVDGAATDVTVQIVHATSDPTAPGGAYAPADVAITGNPATGIVVSRYIEPAVGWWGAVVSGLTGTPVNVSISGKIG